MIISEQESTTPKASCKRASQFSVWDRDSMVGAARGTSCVMALSSRLGPRSSVPETSLALPDPRRQPVIASSMNTRILKAITGWRRGSGNARQPETRR